MFGSLIDYAKLSAASVTTRLIGIVAIAVPFMIAGTFGLAAVYIAISNAYSELTAAIVLAVVFALIGAVVAGVIAAQRKKQEMLKQEALTHARRSIGASALMAANPAVLLGAGRMAVGIFRRAPLLTLLPIAAGFIFALSRSSSSEREEEH